MLRLLVAALFTVSCAATRFRAGAAPDSSADQLRAVGSALASALGVLGVKEPRSLSEGETLAVGQQLSLAAATISRNNRTAMILAKKTFRPLSSSEAEAVGNALNRALGVLSGKQESSSKLSICLGMFPNGAPKNVKDPTWQACKSELAGVAHSASAALILKTQHLRPLSSSEREAVGEALGQALGVLSGKVKSQSKFSICREMFPNGAPPNAKSDVTWQSCKDVVSARGA